MSPWWMGLIIHYFGAVSHELGKCHYLKVVVTAKLLINTWIYKIHKTHKKDRSKLHAVPNFSTTIALLLKEISHRLKTWKC